MNDFDPRLDLQIQRDVALPPAKIWQAWTTPALLMQWFCPKPLQVVACDIDLRPGGLFRTVMQSPDGKDMPANEGTYLAIEPQRRLVWTNAFGPQFRPQPKPQNEHLGFFFVVDLTLQALPSNGTRYRAKVMHQNEAAKAAHEAMGFEQGWGLALDQLVALMSQDDKSSSG